MLLLLSVLKKRCLIEKRCRRWIIDGEKMLMLMMIITWPLIVVGRWQRRKQSCEVAVVMWHCAMSSACVTWMLHGVCGGGG